MTASHDGRTIPPLEEHLVHNTKASQRPRNGHPRTRTQIRAKHHSTRQPTIATRKFRSRRPHLQHPAHPHPSRGEHDVQQRRTNPHVAQQTLIPWARRFEMELERKVLPERERGEYNVRFDMRSLLRGDPTPAVNTTPRPSNTASCPSTRSGPKTSTESASGTSTWSSQPNTSRLRRRLRRQTHVRSLTDYPTKGEDKAVSLRNSNHPQFDHDFASKLKEDEPKVWAAGGNIRGNEAFALWTRARQGDDAESVLSWIREREAWAARHYGDGSQFPEDSATLSNVAGVVAAMKWRGLDIGEGTMKDAVREVTNGRPRKRWWCRRILRSTKRVEKVEEYNKTPSDDRIHRATNRMAAQVFKRGVGAYKTNPSSVRPRSIAPSNGRTHVSIHSCTP